MYAFGTKRYSMKIQQKIDSKKNEGLKRKHENSNKKHHDDIEKN